MSGTQPGRGVGVKEVEYVKPCTPEQQRAAAITMVRLWTRANGTRDELIGALEAIGVLDYEAVDHQKQRNRSRRRSAA